MKILGIETSSIICAASVVEDGSVLAEKSITEPYIHSEKLIAVIDEVLKSSGGFDAVAISIGPGSFTGLRIGLSVAKGLAYASTIPIISVSTLEALAYNAIIQEKANNNNLICSLIDARRDEFYAAIYRFNKDKLSIVMEPQALNFEKLSNRLFNEEIRFVGDGITKFKRISSEKQIINNLWIFFEGLVNLCSASSIALLGEKKILRNEINDLAVLEPIYVKDFPTLVRTQHS